MYEFAHTNMHTLVIQDHSRNNNVLFLPTLAADVQLKRAGLTNDVIRILHCPLRTLDTERRTHACTNVIGFHIETNYNINNKSKTQPVTAQIKQCDTPAKAVRV